MDSKPSDGNWGKNVQLPTAPPFLLYMGNMDFNVTERDLQIFFGDLEIKNIRIIKDANDNWITDVNVLYCEAYKDILDKLKELEVIDYNPKKDE
jgi:hypothetical protein